MANLINGKEVSASVKSKVKNQTAELIEKSGITPGLAVVLSEMIRRREFM